MESLSYILEIVAGMRTSFVILKARTLSAVLLFSVLTLPYQLPRIASESNRLGCKRLLLSHIGREVLERMGEVALECAHDGLIVEV